METVPQPSGPARHFRGIAGLIVACGVVALLLIALPAYRWFFLISVGIAVVVVAILRVWNTLRPVKEADVNHKRPLGLS
ncbi:MAG TPA: hypothetical protein VLW84_11260 [Terriglobales bacterium]|nr:hypothetical protein [Terriglobales bacterium]